jgi:hypothetical protein
MADEGFCTNGSVLVVAVGVANAPVVVAGVEVTLMEDVAWSMGAIVPVQAAPFKQHAAWPAVSAAQTWSLRQQIPGWLMFVHADHPFAQFVPCRLTSSSEPSSSAVSLVCEGASSRAAGSKSVTKSGAASAIAGRTRIASAFRIALNWV